MSFDAANKICEIENPTVWTEAKNQLFIDACIEMASFHAKNCPEIATLYKQKQFEPESLRTLDDLAKIPTLHVTAMKKWLFTSRPDNEAVLKLTSSGTRGQKTQIWFDAESLHRVQRMMDVLLEEEGLVSKQPTNYLIFNYHPEQAGDLGIAYSEKNFLRFAPQNEVFYSLQKDSKGEWQFLADQALAVLSEYAKQDLPVRVLGMPSFIFEFVEKIIASGETFQLPPGSVLLTSGGWKAAEDKKVSRKYLRERCNQAFGIPLTEMRDGYGLAEHSAPYWECKHHRLHVPAYNHLIIRDPVTLKPVPDGKTGILELITPFNTMMPTLALLTTDWAKINAEPCPCGANSPTFELLGRAGISKHKGCAMTAEDIINKME